MSPNIYSCNNCKFQWFWRDHCKFPMVFEETITIACFLAVWPLTSMVFQWFLDFASIAFNGFQWFRTIGPAIAEMIGQLLTLTIWSNLDKFHYILGGSILSFSWKSEALTASVVNFSVFTQPNISVTGSHSGSLVQYKCKKSTSGQCLLFHSAQYASDTNKHKEHNATKAIHASRCN